MQVFDFNVTVRVNASADSADDLRSVLAALRQAMQQGDSVELFNDYDVQLLAVDIEPGEIGEGVDY